MRHLGQVKTQKGNYLMPQVFYNSDTLHVQICYKTNKGAGTGGEGNKGAIGGHALIKGNTDRQHDEHTSSVVQNSFGYLEFS
jgi:hypothetical protein